MEYMTSWEREGFAKGVIEGKIELTLKLLTWRTGELSAAMRKRIGKLSSAQLDNLGEALLDFHNRSDLNKWLKENLPAVTNGLGGRGRRSGRAAK